MVVGYFNPGRIAVDKTKAYAPLVIDPDTPLSGPVAGKGLKVV